MVEGVEVGGRGDRGGEWGVGGGGGGGRERLIAKPKRLSFRGTQVSI